MSTAERTGTPAVPGTTAVRGTTAEAAVLARAGRYDAARRVLDLLGGPRGDDVEVLDLLARVHAQQGDLVAADACWESAERLDPGHAGARDGRRRIRETWAGERAGTGRHTGAVVAALLLAGGGAAAGWALAPDGTAEGRAGGAPATGEQLAGLHDETARLRDEIGELRAELDADRAPATAEPAEADPADRLRALRDALDDPRWTTVAGPGSGTFTVVPAEALFLAGGAETSESGREVLADVAALLDDAEGLKVTVVGHTSDTLPDPGGPYADNAAVGLARALEAAGVVADESGLPLSSIGIATAGEAGPPHPNTTAENRRRNQTVTLVIGAG
ncbi:OmpA family protein [Myceligenerans pegani]|uniref:OmpA-like domain-containing protein n=1 Tax=Myceligenerans pegani TaxID=2776917 RepID=A0ABR9N3Z1_9MICO|nr:OmpA family protein [Myceligenerans sp. TRM 65318]MBE1878388.1 hypothetical protein [Myceligenerans sp. TRM 65318]MBE3020659.1 hypothetical protein [Myceligenerans sp. TRM 65318]